MAISNEVLTCIRERRSTRNYTDEQISAEQLDALLEAAIWAPSGSNSQSWLFTAIQKQDVLLHINELVREGFRQWEPDDDYPAKHAVKKQSQNESFNFYYHAPTLIIASNVSGYENAMADCSLALENTFLAAGSMGLGSCYINHLYWLRKDPGLREYLAELGIPMEHVICSAAAVGFIGKALPGSGPQKRNHPNYPVGRNETRNTFDIGGDACGCNVILKPRPVLFTLERFVSQLRSWKDTDER